MVIKSKLAVWLLTMGMTGLLTACQEKEAPAPPPPPVRVENPQMELAIAALSPDFAVVSSDGATIELRPTGKNAAGEGLTGTISVSADESGLGGPNLVAATQAHKAAILERPDGEYKGQAEYMSPMGTTFASRGRYTGDAGTVEERIVLMVHPWGDRILRVTYTYPAGDDTQARLDALMTGVVGEIESYTPAAGDGSDAGSGDAAEAQEPTGS